MKPFFRLAVMTDCLYEYIEHDNRLPAKFQKETEEKNEIKLKEARR